MPLTNSISRFKVTPVVEDNTFNIPAPPDVSSSQSAASSEQSHIQSSTKKHGRFQITRVADSLPLSAAQTPVEVPKTSDSVISQLSVDTPISIPAAKLSNIQNTVPANVSQNILLQHSCSNPALVSSIPDKLTPCSQNSASLLTRSVSDIAFANGQPVQNFETDSKGAVHKNFQNLSEKESQMMAHSASADYAHNAEQLKNITISGILSSSDRSTPDVSSVQNENKYQNVASCTDIAQKPQIIEDSPYTRQTHPIESSVPNLLYSFEPVFSQSTSRISSGINTDITNVSYSTADTKFSQYPAAYPTLIVPEVSRMPVSSIYLPSEAESGLTFSRMGNSAGMLPKGFPPPSDSSAKTSDLAPVYASSEQVIQMQQSMVKDANANTVHSCYSISDGKHVQVRILEAFEISQYIDIYIFYK